MQYKGDAKASAWEWSGHCGQTEIRLYAVCRRSSLGIECQLPQCTSEGLNSKIVTGRNGNVAVAPIERGHRLKCRRHGLRCILSDSVTSFSSMTQLLDANAARIAGLSRAA